MKNVLIGLIIFLGFMTPGLQAAEPDPITGQLEAGRSCIERDQSGACVEWKIEGFVVPETGKVINIAERVCIAPPTGECSAQVARGNDRAVCKAAKGAHCRARVILR